MPTRRQMEQLARAVGGKTPSALGLAPNDDLPPEYWQALLEAADTDAGQAGPGASGRLRLSRVPDHVLRVGCRRCGRTVEIQKADAVRLYGPESVWRDVGQRLLDDTCTQRTGRYEEDGCWPSFS
ncbi:conserved protein of unknown function [Bradyrhizobium sp. ORS 285]|uniref:hypothetical protein n=1 Tax=Bradyrhizobium sp. ORS 285 TaxID=115808 RepID=UPI00068177DD|nr:hypothetical protein [Bradyrhizobium sp. ORS 285]SMX61260.1 conserved protein of unknown function [Bradyrhizobium sp. ORS 285]